MYFRFIFISRIFIISAAETSNTRSDNPLKTRKYYNLARKEIGVYLSKSLCQAEASKLLNIHPSLLSRLVQTLSAKSQEDLIDQTKNNFVRFENQKCSIKSKLIFSHINNYFDMQYQYPNYFIFCGCS